MVIDPATPLGKCRLRCGDFGDIPLLPDSVYTQALIDSGDNVNRASLSCATYILAILSQQTHRRIATLETWGREKFTSYLQYVTMIAKDPSFNGQNPIPYSGATTTEKNPLIKFQEDWALNFANGTQSEQLSIDAVGSATTGM